MSMRLTEPTDETLHGRTSSTAGPRETLARWVATAKGIGLFLGGGLVLWSALLLAYGAAIEYGGLAGESFVALAVLLLALVATAKLWGAYVFPARY